MSVPYQGTGRVNQKGRTLQALIDAARALIANGVTPTIEEAAAEASVSRTTAYRYFPTQQALLVAAYPEIGQSSVLGEHPPEDIHTRFALVLTEMERQIIDNEGPLRTMLRLSLETPATREQLPLRQGRRRTWVADALGPLRTDLAEPDFDRLVLAITATTGIETYIWLTDIAGLTREQALETMRFSANTLLETALR